MPMYEYKCRKCGHRFERIQKFSDPPVKSCPKCKKGKVEKLISSPSVQFKGSGWYVTDYGGKKAPAAEASSEPTTAKSSDKDGSKDAPKEAPKESPKEKKTKPK